MPSDFKQVDMPLILGNQEKVVVSHVGDGGSDQQASFAATSTAVEGKAASDLDGAWRAPVRRVRAPEIR